MVTLQAFALTLSLTGAGQTVLLDFYSDSCPPCRQMMPVVAQLESAGYPVQKINVSHQRQAAQQYGVSGVPCFILVSDGRIVDRVVGATSQQRLLQMFATAGYRLNADEPELERVNPTSQSAPATGGQAWLPDEPNIATLNNSNSNDSPTPSNRGASVAADSLTPTERAMAASVRLKISQQGSHSYGSGTIIDVHDQEALVLTCGHIFNGGGNQGDVAVDLFDHHGEHAGSVAGRVISFDQDRDVGLVAIHTDNPLTKMPIAGPGYRVERGARVFSIGCDRGAPPSVRQSRVTHINKYLGPANIEVAGAPIDGRSGGGLFTADGKIIGVCNAADPTDDEGLYAALETIHTELTAANLSFIYASNQEQVAAAPAPKRSDSDLPQMPRRASEPNISMPHMMSSDTELILIVRSKSKPDQQGEVLFIDRPSRGLLDAIAAQRTPAGPQPTSLEVKDAPTFGQPIIRGQQ